MWRTNQSIPELRAAFAAGLRSPADLLESCLRSVRLIESLNAFIQVEPTESLEREAAEAGERWRAGRPRGPLDGIPVSVKDAFCTTDRPATCGSEMLRPFVPPFDATVVERLRRAGAIVVGKTNLDEFAMGSGGTDSAFGPSRLVMQCSFTRLYLYVA